MENLSKEELFFEREKTFLDCTYAEHIRNIYFQIKEYLSGSFLLDKLELIDLEEIIIQYSSLYDIYYESDEENNEEIGDEYY
jgi:hypothetical protein|tara:strand:+ start:235 stop:480 length:246 start_codon:yes stop_codon:yes gene_type:complete